MNLDEAIIHAKTKAKELEDEAETVRSCEESNVFPKSLILEKYRACIECAADHKQLASWLEELKCYREITCAKNTTLIIDEVFLNLSHGHINAMLKYEKEQTGEGVITRHMRIKEMLGARTGTSENLKRKEDI